MLKDVFGFVEHQEKATYGLGYKVTSTRVKDDAVIDKAAGIADARYKIDHIRWYVPHYTTSIQQQGIFSNHVLSKTYTELRYDERSVFLKELNIQNLLNFELGSQESSNVPMGNFIGFQHRAWQDSQNQKKDVFCRLPVVSAPAVIGMAQYSDSGILTNYDDDDYSQAYAQIKEVFKAITKVDILQPYISDHDCRSSNLRADHVGHNLYVSDIKCQQNLTPSQPIEVESKIHGVSPSDINSYALMLTNNLVSIGSDGQRHFDLFLI